MRQAKSKAVKAFLGILCALLFSAMVADRAGAEPRADTDGDVPLIWECMVPQPAKYDGTGVARTGWTTVVTHREGSRETPEYRNEVHLDRCLVEWLGGGPLDLLRIYRHEMAHAKDGREHYEGSPDPRAPNYNAAYWPKTPLTGL